MQYIALGKKGDITSVSDCENLFEAKEVLAQLEMPEDYFVFIASIAKWNELCQTVIEFQLNEEKYKKGLTPEVQKEVMN